MGISLHRDPTGEIGVEVRCLPGTSKNSKKSALEAELLSLWWLCEGNLEGGLLSWRL